MGLLARRLYNPAAVVSKATDTVLDMVELDTANLRNNFVMPANGLVMVKLKGVVTGATTFPGIKLGIRDTGVNLLRMTPMGASMQAQATTLMAQECSAVISGIAGTTYNWDATYGVENVVASTNLKYGGPNDASGADAYGGFLFEIWEATNCLASVVYDTSTATTKSTTTLKALTAFDTTNMRANFTTRASGPGSTQVWVRGHTQFHGSATAGAYLFGLLSGASVVQDALGQNIMVAPTKATPVAGSASTAEPLEVSFVVDGLTPSTNYTWDFAYNVQVAASAGGLKTGGPGDTTANNMFGCSLMEVWGC
jgi:hypothetical protein